MILVTGANGFVGSAVTRRLSERTDRPIRALVRPGSSTSRIDDLIDGGRVSVLRGTLNRSDDCDRAVTGVDTVYHFAAGMGGGAMADVWIATVVATDNLLQAVRRRSGSRGSNGDTPSSGLGRFVHCSSFAVYGVADLDAGAVVDESTPIESDPARADDYALAKLRQEKLVRDACGDLGIDLVVVRPGVVYGPGGGAVSRRVGIKQGSLLVAFGGDNTLPLAYIDNCADAIVLVGEHPSTAGETYNILDDDLVTANDFVRRYRREAEPLKVLKIPKPLGRGLARAVSWYHDYSKGQLPEVIDPHYFRATWGGNRFSNQKLKSIGWRPAVSTDDGLGRHFAFIAGSRPLSAGS